MNHSIVCSHSQWQPLKEVWIGGTWPESFYGHLGTKTHDIFSQITEITNSDFDSLERALQGLGVRVVRPQFHTIDHYLDEQDRLLKPPISPCDIALALGDTLHIMPQYTSGASPYQHALDRYINNDQKVHIIDRATPEPWAWLVFASVVRAGRDLMIDYVPNIPQSKKYAHDLAQDLGRHYRVHLSGTGDHSDGVFCPLRPGHIMTSHYRSVYQQTFPGWKVFHLPKHIDVRRPYFGLHRKWYVPGIDFGHFNQDIISIAQHWLGNPQETVWEVNMLMVDEHNVICGVENDLAFKYFESIGITPHVVDFKSRMFWDAGIHCVTCDIHRAGDCEDYWPDRGPNGVYQISEWSHA